MDLEVIVAGLSGAYLINNSILPFASVVQHKVLPSKRSKTKNITEKHSPNIEWYKVRGALSISNDERALTYLYVANRATGGNTLRKREDILKTNCKEISEETYANFLYLVERDNLPELKDYVRLARGSIKLTNQPVFRLGHSWLELYNGSQWIPFECATGELAKSTKTSNFPVGNYFTVYTAQKMSDGNWKYNIPIKNLIFNWHSGYLQLIPGALLHRR